jgi:hypothetical protein
MLVKNVGNRIASHTTLNSMFVNLTHLHIFIQWSINCTIGNEIKSNLMIFFNCFELLTLFGISASDFFIVLMYLVTTLFRMIYPSETLGK